MESKLAFARKLIRQAGQEIKKSLGQDLEIESKGSRDDLVTNLDKSVQDFLVAEILRAYPNDYILAEENDLRHDLDDGSVWVIDPIDGTLNFIVQEQDFCVLLAYFEEGLGQFGLIYHVMTDTLYSGGPDYGVYCNQTKLLPYTEGSLEDSLMICNSRMYADNDSGVRDLIGQSLGVRMYGAAGISLSYILSGRLLAYFSQLYIWDYAPAMIMGKALGYEIITFEGEVPKPLEREKVMFIPSVHKKSFCDYLKK